MCSVGRRTSWESLYKLFLLSLGWQIAFLLIICSKIICRDYCVSKQIEGAVTWYTYFAQSSECWEKNLLNTLVEEVCLKPTKLLLESAVGGRGWAALRGRRRESGFECVALSPDTDGGSVLVTQTADTVSQVEDHMTEGVMATYRTREWNTKHGYLTVGIMIVKFWINSLPVKICGSSSCCV